MSVFYMKRGPAPSYITIVPVTITGAGTGTDNYAYVTIGGTQYTAAADGIEVVAGDVISCSVYGYSATYYGEVTVDGSQMLKVTNRATSTYEWTVPDGVESITIALDYYNKRYGRIAITTA